MGKRYDRAGETTEMDSYTLWHAKGNYDFSRNIRGYIQIENIGDKQYQVIDGYATAGRSYYAGAEVAF